MLKGFAPLFLPENIRFLGFGLLVTLKIAFWSVVISFAGGTVLAIARFTGDRFDETPAARWVGTAAGWYVEVIRNLPMLLIMLVVRISSGLPAVWAGIAGISIFVSAVMAEIVRGGLLSVDKGQWEAATASGMTYLRVMYHIVLPQALRKMIPPIVSQFITVVKDTAFVWALGVEEITGRGVIIFAKYLNPMQTFFTIACSYFLVNFTLSRVARGLERRLAVRSF